jgi:hypothetical protein
MSLHDCGMLVVKVPVPVPVAVAVLNGGPFSGEAARKSGRQKRAPTSDASKSHARPDTSVLHPRRSHAMMILTAFHPRAGHRPRLLSTALAAANTAMDKGTRLRLPS